MSTMTWLAKWSVRNCASCFSVCRFSLDDHELTSSPRVAMKNMAFDKKNETSFNSICNNNNLSRPSKNCNNKRQINNPIIKDKDGVVPNGNKFDHSCWSLSADEDYIIFCFGGENGALDVVKDDKCVKSEALIRGLEGMHKNSRAVNRKLKFDENEEQDSDPNIHEKRSIANQNHIDQHDQDCVTLYKDEHCHHPNLSLQEEEKVMVHTHKQQHRNSIRRACRVEGLEDRGIESVESRDSDQFEGNRGSFAFPVLGWEWIGSPVRMP